MKIPEQMIPAERPSWFEKWPARAQYMGKFPDGIRLHYIRTGAPNINAVQFTQKGFLVTIDGSFQTQWLLEGDQWQRKCSCNYPKDTCVHAWYATIVMEYICRKKGWEISGERKKSNHRDISKNEKTGLDNNVSLQNKGKASQMDLPFGGAQTKTDGKGKSKLEIEVDFKLNPGQVTLRFYENKDDRRSIIKMQQLFNLTQMVSMKRQVNFRQRDIDFLLWVRHQIKEKHVWQNNLQVLKLLPSRFDTWVQSWKHEPDRFIDRETQKPLALQVAAELQFEIHEEGEKTRIHCFLATSPENRQQFHRVFPTIQAKQKCLLNGVKVNLDLAISWQTLVDCFSKKSPAMPTNLLCDHLPVILEGRLDLLIGDNIIHRQEEVDLELRVRTDDSRLIFEALKDGKVFSSDGFSKSEMKKKDGKFLVTTYKSPVLDTLRLIPEKMDPGGDAKPDFSQSEKIMDKFLDTWPQLDIPKSASSSLQPVLESHTPKIEFSLKESHNWLEYSIQWQVGDLSLSHEEIEYISQTGRQIYRTPAGQWVNLDMESVQESLKNLKKANIHKGKGSRLKMEGRNLLELVQQEAVIKPSCQQLAEKIRNAPQPSAADIPGKIKTILRPYQKDGVDFMHHRHFYGLGVILADDMGLGKTLQTLALIGSQKRKDPVLVVAPSSVLYVWQDEAQKFVPDLKVAVLSGNREKRNELLSRRGSYDLLITSYHLVRNDLDQLKKIDFSMVVLDEAQFIKNPAAKITRAVKSLHCEKRLALSGTPVENRLSDLWSLFDFINPGYLGTLEKFNQNYEQGGASRQELAARVAPMIIRRTKDKVARELPPRTEELIRCTFDKDQAALYRKVLEKARRDVKEQGFSIFAALTRLRQTCCDPRLLKQSIKEFSAEHSTKLKCLLDMVAPIIDEGHSVLIFSQFTSMLEIIEEELDELELNNFKLTGATPTAKRPVLIKEFNDCPEPSAFLLSLKAAGTGLTLTKADYVFIYDPWWNPAAEQQAIDRTHRIGQDKPVFVYKLAVRQSVEDKILKLQEDKKQMIADVLEDDAVPGHLSADELAGLLEDG